MVFLVYWHGEEGDGDVKVMEINPFCERDWRHTFAYPAKVLFEFRRGGISL
jgi:hypothetical protein